MDLNDTNILSFEEEFNGVQFLNNAQVASILEEAKDNFTVNEVFEKTLAHAKRFSGYSDTTLKAQTVKALVEDLQNRVYDKLEKDGSVSKVKLHMFQTTSLINLDPLNYDEAVALIPSLTKVSGLTEKQINEVLNTIAKSRNR